MGSSTKHRFSAMSIHSLVRGTPEAIKEWLTSLPQDSRVNRSHTQEIEKEKQTSEICGHKQRTVLALYDLKTASWKTSQVSLLTNTLSEYSETWPRWGMIVDGELSEVETWVSTPREIGFGLFVGTVRSSLMYIIKKKISKESLLKSNFGSQINSIEYRICKKTGMLPSMGLLEWIMDWPIMWAELKPLAMDKYQQWYEQHGKF